MAEYNGERAEYYDHDTEVRDIANQAMSMYMYEMWARLRRPDAARCCATGP